MHRFIFLLLLLLSPTLSFATALPDATGITTVRVVGPSWTDFTNRDGTGLYHEILDALFALYDIEVQRHYVPSQRAYHLVAKGEADFMTCHDKPVPPLVLAKHPMYEGQYCVFFNRDNINPWSLPQSLEGRTISWRIGYYNEENIPAKMQVKEVKTGVSALGMVILDRVDFYLDDRSFIEDSIRNSKLTFDRSHFRIEPIGTRSYRPVFGTSKRGKQIMELYDRGMEALYQNGTLQKIFSKWHFPMPGYEMP